MPYEEIGTLSQKLLPNLLAVCADHKGGTIRIQVVAITKVTQSLLLAAAVATTTTSIVTATQT